MASTDGKPNPKKGRLAVIHRAKHDKKDISREPEMKELRRMLQEGELDPERTLDHIKAEDDDEEHSTHGKA